MQLQYIGARYVPIFYHNTVDDTANWQINVEYEPLTFVTTVNNHLYLSKKTVPDNIGTPASNTEYWLDMGVFINPQIAELVAEIGDLDSLTTTNQDSLVDAINEVNGNIGNLGDLDTEVTSSIVDAINSLAVKKVLDPDDFAGDNDITKLQDCVDYAIQNGYRTITLHRKYDITGDHIDINKGLFLQNDDYYRYRSKLTFIGDNNACIYKGDSGFMFSAGVRSGDIAFINVHFEGGVVQTSSMSQSDIITARYAGCSVFDCSKLINLTTINCSFTLVGCVFDGSASTNNLNNMQSIRSIGDLITYSGSACRMTHAWAIVFEGDIIENCNVGIAGYRGDPTSVLELTDLSVHNTIIENIADGYAIDFDRQYHSYSIIKGVTIMKSYFEDCATGCMNIVPNNVSQGLHIDYNIINNTGHPTNNCIELYNDGGTTISVSKNTITCGGIGIHCSNVNIANDFSGNAFIQISGNGSLTNNTGALTKLKLKTVRDRVTTASLAGNASSTVTITNFGDITEVIAIIIEGVTPWSNYNTRCEVLNTNISTGVCQVHTYGSGTQQYDITYNVIGY